MSTTFRRIHLNWYRTDLWPISSDGGDVPFFHKIMILLALCDIVWIFQSFYVREKCMNDRKNVFVFTENSNNSYFEVKTNVFCYWSNALNKGYTVDENTFVVKWQGNKILWVIHQISLPILFVFRSHT